MRAIRFHQMAVIAYFIQKQKLKIVKIPKSLKFQELMYVYLKQSLKSLEYSFWYKTCKYDLLQEFDFLNRIACAKFLSQIICQMGQIGNYL